MSLVKYRVKEVAADFGVAPKVIAEIVGKFFEKPKSNTQVLTDDELNVVFDYMTQTNQIDSLEVVFAVQAQSKQEEAPAPAAEPVKEEKAQKKEAPAAKSEPAKVAEPAKTEKKPEKPAEPERKRERRVVDTSAVQVNSARFDDRVDNLVSERMQNYSGGKQRIGGKKGQQQNKKDNKFKGNKAKNEEQEKLRRLQMEVARKAPVTVKIPEEITVGELASRMKKTAGEVIKCLMKNGV
ncbi:MAG: translation initiation factor IF-2, partial [Oscillospiraceae bacterium]|nr:translation initiation factor IF-2 [Oscillospiraceae bacterium]